MLGSIHSYIAETADSRSGWSISPFPYEYQTTTCSSNILGRPYFGATQHAMAPRKTSSRWFLSARRWWRLSNHGKYAESARSSTIPSLIADIPVVIVRRSGKVCRPFISVPPCAGPRSTMTQKILRSGKSPFDHCRCRVPLQRSQRALLYSRRTVG